TDTLLVEVRPARPLYVEVLAGSGGVAPHLVSPGGRFGLGPPGDDCADPGAGDCSPCSCFSLDRDGDRVPDLASFDWGPGVEPGDGDPGNDPGLFGDRGC